MFMVCRNLSNYSLFTTTHTVKSDRIHSSAYIYIISLKVPVPNQQIKVRILIVAHHVQAEDFR